MPIEIERKFLVISDSWRASCSKTERLKDGLVAASADRKVRVRIYADKATITIKSKRDRQIRLEYEYQIPIADAEELLSICDPFKVEKRRHYVNYAGYSWVIDEYEGLLSGTVIAEIELDDPHSNVPLPDWVGAEVTNDPAYGKIRMLTSQLSRADNSDSNMLHKCVLCYSGL
jgi:CYTH domain-containing protein